MDRINIEQYALFLAHVAALRSEDLRKVGAVAINFENRVIGTAYNGLTSGMPLPESFRDRENPQRNMMMMHAEENLCSLFRRGEVKLVATTIMPCGKCAKTLIAHGVKRVIYGSAYERDTSATDIFKFYGISYERVTFPRSYLAELAGGLEPGGFFNPPGAVAP